jgi:hypothetical protein
VFLYIKYQKNIAIAIKVKTGWKKRPAGFKAAISA